MKSMIHNTEYRNVSRGIYAVLPVSDQRSAISDQRSVRSAPSSPRRSAIKSVDPSSSPGKRSAVSDQRSVRSVSSSLLPTPVSRLPSGEARLAARAAFTLIELLVVISIIAILMSILLPALSHFRTEGYITSTTEELTSVKAACLDYYAHFDAYPGLFPEADISAATSPIAGTVTYTDSAGHTYALTGTQNMLLSLMGPCYTTVGAMGASPPPYTTISVSGTAVAYVPYTMGAGPIDYANGSQQLNAFLTPAQAVLQTQPPTTGTATPTSLPTLYDEFPSGIPILYWRRNSGSAANYPAGSSAANTANADFWLNCNLPYFDNASLSGVNGITYDESTSTSPHYSTYNNSTNQLNAFAALVVNQTLAPSPPATPNYAAAPNSPGFPVQGDFVLESAGPDHTYGPTATSISTSSLNWGTVAGQCDDIFVFGGQ